MVRGELLLIHSNHINHGGVAFCQTLVYPLKHQRNARLLTLQPAVQFSYEGRGELRIFRVGLRKFGDLDDQRTGVFIGDPCHSMGPFLGGGPFTLRAFDPDRDPTQIFEQGQTEHNRHRPQFAQSEGRVLLIGSDEAVEAVVVDPAIGVGNQFQGQGIDPGQADGITHGQTRQLAAVTAWQMPPHQGDVLTHLVIIVEQPLARRNRRLTCRCRLPQKREHLIQDQRVFTQTGEE